MSQLLPRVPGTGSPDTAGEIAQTTLTLARGPRPGDLRVRVARRRRASMDRRLTAVVHRVLGA